MSDASTSKFLHQILPDSPHAGSLAENIHGYGRDEANELDHPNIDEDALWAVRAEPIGEEEGKSEAVKDVCGGKVSLIIRRDR